MIRFMEMGVKPLIEVVPEVGKILEQYGIGCAQCTIGTCQVGEVVKFHGLPPESEAEMWSQIAKAIHSSRASHHTEIEEVQGVQSQRS
jgi:hypothetical protein